MKPVCCGIAKPFSQTKYCHQKSGTIMCAGNVILGGRSSAPPGRKPSQQCDKQPSSCSVEGIKAVHYYRAASSSSCCFFLAWHRAPQEHSLNGKARPLPLPWHIFFSQDPFFERTTHTSCVAAISPTIFPQRIKRRGLITAASLHRQFF